MAGEDGQDTTSLNQSTFKTLLGTKFKQKVFLIISPEIFTLN